MFNSWLHLIALATYLGAVTGLLLLLLPSLSLTKEYEDRVQLLVRGLKLYNPLHIGSLGVLLVSGAVQLTELKAAYRELFIKQLGMTLGWKLALAFLLVLCSVYQSMGVGHRFVRRTEGGQPVSPQELNSVTRRLKSQSWVILLLALVTLWVGLRLGA